MCIGRPLRILEMHDLSALCEDPGGARESLDMSLLGAQAPGTWVLAFLGHARAVLDAAEAQRVHAALQALGAVMRGESPDIDECFADLAGREPQLPEHLRRPAKPN